MPVLSPERDLRHDAPPRVYRPRRGILGGAVRVLAVIVAVLLGWTGLQHIGDLLPDWGNPFKTEQVDRTGPAVLKALADLHEYRAATGSYQVMIDIEKDAKYLPSILKGERTLFLAQGSVDAAVDFSGLGAEAVTVNPDGSVSLALPHARLTKPVLDTAASRVVDRDRGLLDRIGSVFTDTPTGEQDLYAAAEPKLRAAADESSLIKKAEENTTGMLARLLAAVGFDRVSVTYLDSPE